MQPIHRVSRDRFDAVLFDLDGVLTPTATLHAAAWKQMFDAFLRHYATEHGIPFIPFDIDRDYKLHVDGKSRRDGVQGFIDSRGIALPPGAPDDPVHLDTVYGLGNRKDELVDQVMRADGVQPYPGSVHWVRQLRREGFKIGVVSSSRNCRTVLQAAGIEELFDTRVDGSVAEVRRMPGKPQPDMFLTAAEELGVAAARSVVVEDALAGVQAGKRGRFGLVIGVAREDGGTSLLEAGADFVISDLAELTDPSPASNPLNSASNSSYREPR